MSLYSDLNEYVDGNGLVTPNKVNPNDRPKRGSDNGVLYTAQAILLDPDVASRFVVSLGRCVDLNNFLHRAPDDTSEDAPDDHYGYLATKTSRNIPTALEFPFKITQPALLYMRGIANGKLLWRFYSPLMAFVIAFSNILESTEETSDKLLTWTIIKGLENRSLLCKLAGRVWTYRMRKQYLEGTLSIAKIYFGSDHPFVKYWKE